MCKWLRKIWGLPRRHISLVSSQCEANLLKVCKKRKCELFVSIKRLEPIKYVSSVRRWRDRLDTINMDVMKCRSRGYKPDSKTSCHPGNTERGLQELHPVGQVSWTRPRNVLVSSLVDTYLLIMLQPAMKLERHHQCWLFHNIFSKSSAQFEHLLKIVWKCLDDLFIYFFT